MVVKPSFLNKIVGTNRVILRDSVKIIFNAEKVADTFNKFFVTIGNPFKIDKNKRFLVESNDISDLAFKATKKYAAHPSILSIKEKMNNSVFFSKYHYVEILNEINADIFNDFILQNVSKCIIDGKFPDQLKIADVSPVFKKGNHNDKTNYRPVSILLSLSKIYEYLI